MIYQQDPGSLILGLRIFCPEYFLMSYPGIFNPEDVHSLGFLILRIYNPKELSSLGFVILRICHPQDL